MGYSVHVKRTSNENPITLEEWFNYINNDQGLEYIERIETKNPLTGEIISLVGQGMAIWKTENEGERYEITFDFRQDKISARYVAEFQIKKMKEIACRLHGIVVGDEGEEY